MRERLLEVMPGSISEAMLRLNRRVASGTNISFYHELRRIHVEIEQAERVMQGPFKGTRMTPQLRGNWLRQVLGTYEKEAWPAVEQICERSPDLVVNVGAAAGYYSIGFARRLPKTRVVAFEGQRLWRHMHQRNARANAVADRIDLRGFCTPDDLRAVTDSVARPAVLVDCEGGEDLLLDPMKIPALARSIIMVELHDFICTGVSARLRERFLTSHRIEEFAIERRTLADLPDSCTLKSADAMLAMDERRQVYPQHIWLMTPHD